MEEDKNINGSSGGRAIQPQSRHTFEHADGVDSGTTNAKEAIGWTVDCLDWAVKHQVRMGHVVVSYSGSHGGPRVLIMNWDRPDDPVSWRPGQTVVFDPLSGRFSKEVDDGGKGDECG